MVRDYFGESNLRFCVYIGDGWRISENGNGRKVAENDVSAFNKPDLGMRIVVSEEPVTGIPQPYITFPAPLALGIYLKEYR